MGVVRANLPFRVALVVAGILLVSAAPTVAGLPIDPDTVTGGSPIDEADPTDPADPTDLADPTEPVSDCLRSFDGDVAPGKPSWKVCVEIVRDWIQDTEPPDLLPDDPTTGPEDIVAVSEGAHTGETMRIGTRPDADPADRTRPAAQASPGQTSVPARGHLPLLALAVLALIVPATLILYRRLSRDDILDNDIRQRTVELLRSRPGLTAGRAARILEVSDTTARYHLGLLEEFDHVETRDDGGRTRYYIAGQLTKAEKRLARELRSKTRRQIVTRLLDDRAASPTELAARLGVTKSTVAYHLDRLREAGAVERRADGGAVTYRVPETVRSRLDRVGAGSAG